MERRVVVAWLAWFPVACIACGNPVRFGALPRMSPIGQSRDPDPTRTFDTGMGRPTAEGDPTTAGPDPLAAGPLSGAVTASSALVWLLGGGGPFLGFYGTFDETGHFERAAKARKPSAVAPPTDPAR